MTAIATLEFSTKIDINEIMKKVSYFWLGGVDIRTKSSIVTFEKRNNIYICVLENFSFHDNAKQEMYRTLNYLVSISDENQIFYYRDFGDINLSKQNKSPVEITIDDVFTQEYCPQMYPDLQNRYFLIRSRLGGF
ncbi:MAG: hypothetical protein AB4290_15530 [Spirulina sp.]